MAKVHKVYEPDFKEMVVRLVLDEGRTIKSVNEEYILGEGSVCSWIKRFEEECESDPEKQDLKELYEENRLLRKQLAEAKKENEFLIPQRHLEKSILSSAERRNQTNYSGNPRYHKGEQYKKFDNILKQDFTVKRPNEKWCTDFTCLYLSDVAKRCNYSIIDLYDKSIVATLNGKRLDAAVAIDTLKIALQKNKTGKDLILHSDQGSQFTSKDFTEYCKKEHIRQSMSKAGCPYDNSVMESFFGTFKEEFIKQHIFDTDEELNNGTIDYIYGYYNHLRPHSSNGYLTPFEKRMS